MRDVFALAAFRSRQQVLRFEAALRRLGVPCQVVTTPRQISMGCGLSVRFDQAHLARARQALAAINPVNLIGLYRVEYDGRNLTLSPV